MWKIPVSEKKCPKNCLKDCCKLPTEVYGPKKDIDIFYIGEGAGPKEHKHKRCFVGSSGVLSRNCIKHIKNFYNYNFSIAFSNVFRGWPRDKDGTTRTPSEEEVNKCIHNIKKDIDRLNPKIIICVGKTSFKALHNIQEDIPIFMQEQSYSEIEINKKVYPVITSIHPAWVLKNDNKIGTSAGFIYTAIFKAVLYALENVKFEISSNFEYKTILSINKLKKVIKRLKNNENLGIDTETENLNRVYENVLYSIQLSDGKKGYVIPYNHFQSPFSLEEKEEIKNIIIDLISSKSKIKNLIFANTKFDMHQFYREFGILYTNKKVIDISFNQYLLEENYTKFFKGYFPKNFGPYSLGCICYKMGFKDYFYGSLDKSIRTNIGNLEIKKWERYGASDAVMLPRIYEVQKEIAKYQNYSKGFELMSKNYFKYLYLTITYSEHCGMRINIKKLRELNCPRTSNLIKQKDKIVEDFNNLISVKNVVKRLRKKSTGSYPIFGEETDTVFDPNKRIHQEMLFSDELGLESVKEDGKFSVDEKFQETYKDVEEVKLLTELFKINKLITTYINNICFYMDKKEGRPDFFTDKRIRASLHSTTVTGRLHSTDPNSQNRPSRGEKAGVILEMYESLKGKCYFQIDYSAFEVRGLGIESNDKSMLNMFLRFRDIKRKFKLGKLNKTAKDVEYETDYHRNKCIECYDEVNKLEEVTKEQRDGIKAIVFGWIYGRGAKSIARQLGIAVDKAEKLINKLNNSVKTAYKWITRTHKLGKEKLYVQSSIGRRRRLWGYLLGSKSVDSKMDRLGPNSDIQGICSDMNIISTGKFIEKTFKLKKDFRNCSIKNCWENSNLIHDSDEGSVPIKDLFKFLFFLEKTFVKDMPDILKKEFGFNLKIPIEVEIKVGIKLSDMKKWDGTIKNAKELVKWVMEEDCKRRDIMFSNKRYKKYINHGIDLSYY